MYCNHCGRQLPEGSTFCNGCGAPVNARPQQQPAVYPPSYGQAAPQFRPPRASSGGPATWVKVVCIVLAAALGLMAGGVAGIAAAPGTGSSQASAAAVARYETGLIDTMTAYTKARIMTEILLGENDLTFGEWDAECEAALRLWDEAEQCAEEYAAAYSALPEAGEAEPQAADSTKQTALAQRARQGGAMAFSAPVAPARGAMRLANNQNASTGSLFKSIMGFPKDQRLAVLAKLQQTDIETAAATLRQLQINFDEECRQESDKMNRHGDVMQAMESAGVFIRTTAKIGVFVCGAALTGGASASGTLAEAYSLYRSGKLAVTAMEMGALVVSGSDLMLEAGQNAANIVVGNVGDKRSPVCIAFKGMADDFGGMRKVTEPLAAVINTAMLGEADGLGRTIWFTDSLESYLNDHKILGIQINGKGNVRLQVVNDQYASMFLQDSGLQDIITKPLPSLQPGMGEYIESADSLIKTAKALTGEMSDLQKELAEMRSWYGGDFEDAAGESGGEPSAVDAGDAETVYPAETGGAHLERTDETVPLARSGSISSAPAMRIDDFAVLGGHILETGITANVNEAFTYSVKGQCSPGEEVGLDMTATMRDREQDDIAYNILSNTLDMALTFYDGDGQVIGTPARQNSPENGKERTLSDVIMADVPENAKSVRITGIFSHRYGNYGNINGSSVGIDISFQVIE